MSGLLYKVAMLERMKRQHILDELKKLNVTHTQDGKSINELSYQDLKEQLVLAIFRRIDIENENQKWY